MKGDNENEENVILLIDFYNSKLLDEEIVHVGKQELKNLTKDYVTNRLGLT